MEIKHRHIIRRGAIIIATALEKMELMELRLARVERIRLAEENKGKFLIFTGKPSTRFTIRVGKNLDKKVTFSPTKVRFNPKGWWGGIPTITTLKNGMAGVDFIGLGHF